MSCYLPHRIGGLLLSAAKRRRDDDVGEDLQSTVAKTTATSPAVTSLPGAQADASDAVLTENSAGEYKEMDRALRKDLLRIFTTQRVTEIHTHSGKDSGASCRSSTTGYNNSTGVSTSAANMTDDSGTSRPVELPTEPVTSFLGEVRKVAGISDSKTLPPEMLFLVDFLKRRKEDQSNCEQETAPRVRRTVDLGDSSQGSSSPDSNESKTLTSQRSLKRQLPRDWSASLVDRIDKARKRCRSMRTDLTCLSTRCESLFRELQAFRHRLASYPCRRHSLPAAMVTSFPPFGDAAAAPSRQSLPAGFGFSASLPLEGFTSGSDSFVAFSRLAPCPGRSGPSGHRTSLSILERVENELGHRLDKLTSLASSRDGPVEQGGVVLVLTPPLSEDSPSSSKAEPLHVTGEGRDWRDETPSKEALAGEGSQSPTTPPRDAACLQSLLEFNTPAIQALTCLESFSDSGRLKPSILTADLRSLQSSIMVHTPPASDCSSGSDCGKKENCSKNGCDLTIPSSTGSVAEPSVREEDEDDRCDEHSSPSTASSSGSDLKRHYYSVSGSGSPSLSPSVRQPTEALEKQKSDLCDEESSKTKAAAREDRIQGDNAVKLRVNDVESGAADLHCLDGWRESVRGEASAATADLKANATTRTVFRKQFTQRLTSRPGNSFSRLSLSEDSNNNNNVNLEDPYNNNNNMNNNNNEEPYPNNIADPRDLPDAILNSRALAGPLPVIISPPPASTRLPTMTKSGLESDKGRPDESRATPRSEDTGYGKDPTATSCRQGTKPSVPASKILLQDTALISRPADSLSSEDMPFSGHRRVTSETCSSTNSDLDGKQDFEPRGEDVPKTLAPLFDPAACRAVSSARRNISISNDRKVGSTVTHRTSVSRESGDRPDAAAAPSQCESHQPITSAAATQCDTHQPIISAAPTPCGTHQPITSAALEQRDFHHPISSASLGPCDLQQPIALATLTSRDSQQPLGTASPTLRNTPQKTELRQKQIRQRRSARRFQPLSLTRTPKKAASVSDIVRRMNQESAEREAKDGASAVQSYNTLEGISCNLNFLRNECSPHDDLPPVEDDNNNDAPSPTSAIIRYPCCRQAVSEVTRTQPQVLSSIAADRNAQTGRPSRTPHRSCSAARRGEPFQSGTSGFAQSQQSCSAAQHQEPSQRPASGCARWNQSGFHPAASARDQPYSQGGNLSRKVVVTFDELKRRILEASKTKPAKNRVAVSQSESASVENANAVPETRNNVTEVREARKTKPAENYTPMVKSKLASAENIDVLSEIQGGVARRPEGDSSCVLSESSSLRNVPSKERPACSNNNDTSARADVALSEVTYSCLKTSRRRVLSCILEDETKELAEECSKCPSSSQQTPSTVTTNKDEDRVVDGVILSPTALKSAPENAGRDKNGHEKSVSLSFEGSCDAKRASTPIVSKGNPVMFTSTPVVSCGQVTRSTRTLPPNPFFGPNLLVDQSSILEAPSDTHTTSVCSELSPSSTTVFEVRDSDYYASSDSGKSSMTRTDEDDAPSKEMGMGTDVVWVEMSSSSTAARLAASVEGRSERFPHTDVQSNLLAAFEESLGLPASACESSAPKLGAIRQEQSGVGDSSQAPCRVVSRKTFVLSSCAAEERLNPSDLPKSNFPAQVREIGTSDCCRLQLWAELLSIRVSQFWDAAEVGERDQSKLCKVSKGINGENHVDKETANRHEICQQCPKPSWAREKQQSAVMRHGSGDGENVPEILPGPQPRPRPLLPTPAYRRPPVPTRPAVTGVPSSRRCPCHQLRPLDPRYTRCSPHQQVCSCLAASEACCYSEKPVVNERSRDWRRLQIQLCSTQGRPYNGPMKPAPVLTDSDRAQVVRSKPKLSMIRQQRAWEVEMGDQRSQEYAPSAAGLSAPRQSLEPVANTDPRLQKMASAIAGVSSSGGSLGPSASSEPRVQENASSTTGFFSSGRLLRPAVTTEARLQGYTSSSAGVRCLRLATTEPRLQENASSAAGVFSSGRSLRPAVTTDARLQGHTSSSAGVRCLRQSFGPSATTEPRVQESASSTAGVSTGGPSLTPESLLQEQTPPNSRPALPMPLQPLPSSAPCPPTSHGAALPLTEELNVNLLLLVMVTVFLLVWTTLVVVSEDLSDAGAKRAHSCACPDLAVL